MLRDKVQVIWIKTAPSCSCFAVLIWCWAYCWQSWLPVYCTLYLPNLNMSYVAVLANATTSWPWEAYMSYVVCQKVSSICQARVSDPPCSVDHSVVPSWLQLESYVALQWKLAWVHALDCWRPCIYMQKIQHSLCYRSFDWGRPLSLCFLVFFFVLSLWIVSPVTHACLLSCFSVGSMP